MVTKKPKGLGMGLEALLGPKVEEKVEQAQAVQELSKGSNSKIVLLPSDVMSGLSGGLSGLGGLVSRLAPKD